MLIYELRSERVGYGCGVINLLKAQGGQMHLSNGPAIMRRYVNTALVRYRWIDHY